MKKSLTILFDADDTSENLSEVWLALLNEKYGTAVTVDDIHDWDVSLAFPCLTREQVYGALEWDELWRRLSPLPGSQRVLRRLYDEGHQLFMVSATGYRHCRPKMDAILSMFPFLDWDHVILTSRKQLIRGDVLIDDGPHNLVDGDYARILFDRPYNRGFPDREAGCVRARGWDEVYAIIEELAGSNN